MPELLHIRDLKVSLKDPSTGREGSVLRGVNLRMSAGERVALVGESGCGKSVTALSILRLLPRPPMEISGGQIEFKGQDLGNLTREQWFEIRGREIGIVFQEPVSSLNPVMSVGEQIVETLKRHTAFSMGEIRANALSLLAHVGLPAPPRLFNQYPHQLSGGMCQRVMIAMAVACSPSLLIADEPTTALDVTIQTQILELLFRMTEEHRLGILLITHNLSIVRGHADRVLVLYLGLVVEEGVPEEIFGHPQHPYTEGLLAALPEIPHRGHSLYNIPGIVPSPFEVITGCVFADRCPRVEKKCHESMPALVEARKGHQARCFCPSGK